MILSLVKYRLHRDRQVTDRDDANLMSSHVKGSNLHAPVLDLDFPHHYETSSTDGHSHLYLDVPVSKWRWRALMIGLYLGGVIEKGYFIWSLRRGGNFVRIPGTVKSTPEEHVKYTYGMFFKLRPKKNS